MSRTPQSTGREPGLPDIHAVLAPPGAASAAVPVHIVRDLPAALELSCMGATQRAWLQATGFTGTPRRVALLPGDAGRLAGAVLTTGTGDTGDPCGPAALLAGLLPSLLPGGTYRLVPGAVDPALATVAWGLGAYRFRRYRGAEADALPALAMPEGIDGARVRAIVEAVWLGRDLINTPANDMGPGELEAAARAVARRHGARISAIVGDDLIAEGFPLIHAVGRASTRAPRLIDMTWGAESAPRVTLCGKGICFDTGGLDIKPASGMLLMKKDMGGAAAALAIAHMVMSAGLDVRLRVLIPAADNAIAGNAFRPGDVLTARNGTTVEIGNTDAEGRLVLADALALADEEEPGLIVSLATLTGAARVALGPELPPLFSTDDAFAAELAAAGERVGDPVWRLPFWPGYARMLDSEVADISNTGEGSFAGAVTAALFLKRFVRKCESYAHLDIYGWRPSAKPLGPKGGEPNVARALFEVLAARHASRGTA
ncbi:MAG: leucyl aminopeptidase family protein [Hyphomicrobiaceae bacterium]